MKFFKHSTTSIQEDGLDKVFLKFGYEGIGLYYAIIERLTFSEKPIDTFVLKSQLKVGKKLEKIWKFLESLEIIYSKNGETFSKLCENFIESYEENKNKTKKRVSQYRDNQTDKKNETRYKQNCNALDKDIDKDINNINIINRDREEIPQPNLNYESIISSPKNYYNKMISDEDFLLKRCQFLGVEKNKILILAETFFKKNDGVKNWENYADFINHFSNWANIEKNKKSDDKFELLKPTKSYESIKLGKTQ